MQEISRSLDHYAGYLAAQGIVSDNIEGWRKGKATKNPLKRWNFNGLIVDTGRDDRIRTCGLCVPNATLYQAEPHPVLSEHYYYSTAS